MIIPEGNKKRPISVWLVYIVSVLMIIFIAIGLVKAIFLIGAIWIKDSDHLVFSKVISVLLFQSIGLAYFGAVFFSIRKHARLGWYLCISTYLSLTAFCFYRLFNVPDIGDGLLEPASKSEQLGMISGNILLMSCFVYAVIICFKDNVKSYFEIK